MKPFKVNRDSWHYKLNKYFFNAYGDNEFYMKNRWEPKHNNFCAYWRVTFFRLVWATILVTGILGILSTLFIAAMANPAGAALGFGLVIAIFGFFFGGPYLGDVIKNRKPSDKPDSIFVAKYKSYKSKVCPSVEFLK